LGSAGECHQYCFADYHRYFFEKVSESMIVLQFFYFLLVIFIAWYVPGSFFLKKLPLTFFQKIVLSYLLGMALWAWQGFLLGYLGFRWLSYIYLLFFFWFWVKDVHISSLQHFLQKRSSWLHKMDWLGTYIVSVGCFIQLTAVWFVGTKVKEGLYFCCGNTADNIFDLAVTHEVAQRFPPFEPGMYPVLLQNYHYWGNLVVGELTRVFALPLIQTEFQFTMLFLSLALGLSAIVFSQLLTVSKNFYRWLLFFLYFGGDAIFFLLLILGKSSSLFSMSSLEDGAKFLSNPPRAFAIVLFFTGLSFFLLWIRKRDGKVGILMSLIMGSLIEFKVYVGIFVLSGFALLGLFYLYKKQYKYLPYLLLTLGLSLLIYLPVNKNAGGLYFTGLWRFGNFITQPALGLVRLDMAREVYYQHHNWLRVGLYELLFFVIYMLAIFGSKLIGLVQTRKSLTSFPNELHIVLITGIIVSFVTGIFFEQTSGGANTFNFLVSIFIIGSIYTALTCYYLQTRLSQKTRKIVVIFIIFLTIPRVAYEGWSNVLNLSRQDGYMIPNAELQGMQFIKQKTPPTALIMVDNRSFSMDKESPYYSFFADRPMFLSGIGSELSGHGINYSQRLAVEKLVFSATESAKVAQVLADNSIDYIVLKNNYTLASTPSAKLLEPVFANKYMKIERVKMYNKLKSND
jgi:hypothetical protein